MGNPDGKRGDEVRGVLSREPHYVMCGGEAAAGEDCDPGEFNLVRAHELPDDAVLESSAGSGSFVELGQGLVGRLEDEAPALPDRSKVADGALKSIRGYVDGLQAKLHEKVAAAVRGRKPKKRC